MQSGRERASDAKTNERTKRNANSSYECYGGQQLLNCFQRTLVLVPRARAPANRALIVVRKEAQEDRRRRLVTVANGGGEGEDGTLSRITNARFARDGRIAANNRENDATTEFRQRLHRRRRRVKEGG